MRRFFFAWLFVLAAVLRAAEVGPGVASEPSRNGATEPQTTIDNDSSKAKRLMSPDTAAKLAAAAPKFEPPVETPAAVNSGESSPVVRETEKPKNQIVRLPRFVVGEPRLHVPENELQVLTPKGRIAYAFDRRPGLRFGPFASLNKTIALEMLADDLLAERRIAEAGLWSLYLVREPGPGESASTRIQSPKGQ